MAKFRPKQVFEQAREAEIKGALSEAASHYASLSAYLRRRGKTVEALTLIRQAARLAPRSTKIRLELALCFDQAGKEEEASSAMAEFASKVFKKKTVEQAASLVESRLKDTPRLRRAFFEAILSLDRTGHESFLGLARAQSELNDLDACLETLLKALQTAPQELDILEAIEQLLHSQSQSEGIEHLKRYQKGKLTAAELVVLLQPMKASEPSPEPSVTEKPLRDLIEDLEKAMGDPLSDPAEEVQPLLQAFRKRLPPILGSDAQAHMDMALAFFEMGLYRESQEELTAIDEQQPLFAQAQALLGEICLKSGSLLAALEAFQRSLRSPHRSDSVDQEARYQLIHIFFRLGDFRAALGAALDLEKQAPEYRDLRSLKNQIQEALERQAKEP